MKFSHTLLALLLFAVAVPAPAAVIYSGLQNIALPTDFDGVYLDIDTGAFSTSTITGWDINPFFGGSAIGNSADFQPARTGLNNDDPIVRLSYGALVNADLFYSTGEGGSGDPVSHLGSGSNQFDPGVEGYLGFKFTTNAAAGPYYGWMRVVLTNNTSGGLIKDWAYDDTGAPIHTPEPGRAILLLLGMLGLVTQRRRK
ncbi:MAG: PEP-CTERM sorting domain-containing protein [Prosthecobacter sp.]|uniref:PEP-CTERM sorting domain-containing protein n=1 Tax=Prosthecobacter sp. TaxID=1965333 RepID=UPI0038FE4DA2